MSSDCSRGLTTLTKCQHNNVNDSIQRKLSDGSGWSNPPRQRFFLALLILLSSLLLPSAAQADIVTVNVLTDEVEDTCPATCSIRAALASANAGDEIQFDVNGTIVLTQGELVVDKDLTITGPGAENLSLDGNSMSRVLKVNSGVTASIEGLTIQNGISDYGGGIYNDGTLTLSNGTLTGNSAVFNHSGTYFGGEGGGFYNGGTLTVTNSTLSYNIADFYGGGGIYNTGTLTLTDSTLSGNSALREDYGMGGGIQNSGGTLALTNCTLTYNSSYWYGGGIFNTGTLTLGNSTISDNSAYIGGGIYTGEGGALTLTDSTVSGNSSRGIVNIWGSVIITNSTIKHNEGGGIDNGSGTVTVTNSTISVNRGDVGGGINNSNYGRVTLTNSTISGNIAQFVGGGINNEDNGDNGATVTLTNSTVSGNSADNYGGGISNWGGTVILANSTLSGNSADNYGGGISNWGVAWHGATVLLNDSTLSSNRAELGGTIYNDGESSEYSGTITLARSILAYGNGDNCYNGGQITSQGDNLSSDNTCFNNNPTLNDRNNTDPRLDPAGLQDNGGPTLTIALQPDSPAIDGVRHGTCPPPDTDQRGVPRPSGARCDIGAVEMSADSAPLTVALDIKPGSAKNHINPRSNEKIAVAILSTGPDSNAEPFDATRVDPRSVRFGPKGAKATRHKVKDVNHDGEADLILYFKNRATGIQCGDTSASLTGETVDGQAIQGSDSVKVVGLRCLDPEALAKLRRLLRYLISIHEDHGYSDHGQGNQGGGDHH